MFSRSRLQAPPSKYFNAKYFAPTVSRRGFTLIELLVVIAIIAILASILFPVFARARENARRTSCLSNVRQIGMGFQQYFQDYDEQFPPHKGDTAWPLGAIQPFLKSTQILRCSSDFSPGWTDTAKPRVTSYVLNGFFPAKEPTATPSTSPYAPWMSSHIASVQSPASVIMMGESPDAWTASYFHAFAYPVKPGDAAHSTWERYEPNRPGDLDYKRHFGGFNAGYLDGHAKWVQWEKVWWDDGSTPPLKGNFDPRAVQ